MNHDEARLAAYIVGDLSGSEVEAFDLHLLGCASCSQAVDEDHRGQRLVGALGAPLADDARSRLHVALHPGRPPSRNARDRRVLLAVAVVAIIAGVGFGSLSRWGHHGSPSASTPISVVAELIGLDSADKAAARVEIVTIDGVTVVVARSAAAFAMPANSRPAEDGSVDTWVVERDGVNVVCVNGDHPLLVASLLEPQRLLELIAEGELL